jgi:peptide/nickel transport system permease protein
MDMKTRKDRAPDRVSPPKPGFEETFIDRVKFFLAPRIRELKFNMHLLSKSATSIAGLILLTLLIVVAAFPWVLAEPTPGTDPYYMPFNRFLPDPLPPLSEGFLLGSGNNGADIYYGIVWGARISMSFSIQVIFVSVAIGTLLGIFSGYKGGFVDELIMRITDVFLSIPSLILVMAIASVLGRDLNATKLALIMVWWSGYTRLIRGQVLSIKENSYIDAARAAGSTEGKIMLRHIFPNSWAPLLVAATMDMGTVVLVMAGLSYLGLGAAHGMAEWGVMINDGQRFFVIGYWWLVFFPGMAILTFVMAFNLLGDGLRDIFDPKMRR